MTAGDGCEVCRQPAPGGHLCEKCEAADWSEVLRLYGPAEVLDRYGLDEADKEPGKVNGAELIAAERARQQDVEGWTLDHDREHTSGELAKAAACYLMPGLAGEGFWPWGLQWWKPESDRIRELTKAGALVAAEIDRLRRDHG